MKLMMFKVNTISSALDLKLRAGEGFTRDEENEASDFEAIDFIVDCLFMLVLHIFYFKV